MAQPQSISNGKKRSADQLESNLESNSSPACQPSTSEPPHCKKVKLEEELACARNSLASGKAIQQALSQSLIKKTSDIIELRSINDLQSTELEKRHAQLMAHHEEQEVLLSSAGKAEELHKAQQGESETMVKKLKQELKEARKESKRSKTECEHVRKIANDTQRVAALQKKIGIMDTAAQAARKALEVANRAAAVAAEVASAKLVDDARGFSARLEKRDAIIELLKRELTRQGIKIPEARVQIGRPK